MRAFIAIDISPDMVSTLEQLVEKEKTRLPRARWVRPANLHLTLRFLGETSESVLMDLGKNLQNAMASYPPMTLEFRGVGFFPSQRRPRVLWVGIPHPPDALARVQMDIESAAQLQGFVPETRKFAPHLTLARFREPRPHKRFAELAEELGDHDFGTSRVDEIVLYQSILRPQGAEYQALQKFALSEAR